MRVIVTAALQQALAGTAPAAAAAVAASAPMLPSMSGHDRITIIGNAGSGKSTLARALAAVPPPRPRLDLDSIFWAPDAVAQPRTADEVAADLAGFIADHPRWVIEGCYGDLAQATLARRPLLILLDPGVQACLELCRARPWEPSKYPSKVAQDAQLGRLLAWVAAYEVRDGTMSRRGHEALFAAYDGPRQRIVALPPLASLAPASG